MLSYIKVKNLQVAHLGESTVTSLSSAHLDLNPISSVHYVGGLPTSLVTCDGKPRGDLHKALLLCGT